MAYPIKTYADIYDTTYGRDIHPENKGFFGHLVIRDSNTAFKDYLLIGCNDDETSNIKSGIRLNRKQVKQVSRALQKFLDRIEPK